MKKSSKILILAMFLVLMCCVGAASAAEIDNSTADSVSVSDEAIGEVDEVSEDTILASVDEVSVDDNVVKDSQELQLESNNDTIEVFVNQNASSGGDGSNENPFNNLQDAHDKIINSSSKNAIINIADGEYQIPCKIKASSSDPDFAFRDINLTVNGLGDNVVLSSADRPSRTFHINTGSNLTINNIIFDISVAKWDVAYGFDRNTNKAVALTNSLINVNNCTFTFKSKYVGLVRNEYDINYVDCIFINANTKLFTSSKGSAGLCNFENCILVNPTFSDSTKFITDDGKITINGIWLGTNTLPNMDSTCLEKYAIFSVSENYLGNNLYEIIGKLTWNGTDSCEGMENFPPMTVTLTSDTGDIQNATLTNGIFRTIYNSSSSEHRVTAKLDLEEINLTFTNVNLVLDAPNISYGDSQNITVTLPQAVSGVVTVTVNGKDYLVAIENSSSVTVHITDVLEIGTYDVNVTFFDETNHIYGFNTTTITISQVSDYDFDATIPSALYIGDSATVTLDLPTDADGNVSIKIGDKEAKTFDIKDSIIINDFAVGTNTVNVTYLGNGKYVSKSVVKSVSVSLKPTAINTSDVSTIYDVAKDLIITLNDVDGKVLANKTVNVVVGTIDANLTTDANGQVALDVSKLTPNAYTATITFLGDEAYANSTASASVVVNKIASKITAPAVSTTYNVAKKLVITLKESAGAMVGQKVTVKVGTISKTLTTNANGQVSVDISKLTPKKYTATITYKGDSIYNAKSTTAKVTVNKATPKITAKATAFKVNTKTKKYTALVKDNKGKALAKAKVTLRVNGVTYKATTNSKGQAIFKITKLTKTGKFNAIVKFAGDANYKAISQKTILNVKK